MGWLKKVKKGAFEYHFPEGHFLSLSSNFSNARTSVVSLPGEDGGYDTYQNRRPTAQRGIIQASFVLRANDKGLDIETQKQQVAEKVWELHRIADLGRMLVFAQFEDSADEFWCPVKIENLSTPQSASAKSDYYQVVSLMFSAPYPFWRRLNPALEVPIYNGGYKYNSGVKYGGSVPYTTMTGLSNTHQIDYKGNATSPVKIKVKIPAGQSVSWFSVKRTHMNQHYEDVVYGLPLAAGDTLVIDGLNSAILKNGADGYDSAFRFNHPDWMRISPGVNTFTVKQGLSSDQLNIKFNYYEAFRR